MKSIMLRAITALVVCSAAAASAALTPEMLAHRWSFNGDYTDSAGGLTATPTGSPTFGDGMIKLPGGDKGAGNVDLGENALSVGSDNVTIEIWARQHGVRSWARIFDYYAGSVKENDIYMSWNRNGSYETDRSEVKINDKVVFEESDQLKTYTTDVLYHISMVFTANSDGSTTVTCAKRDTSTGVLLNSYTRTISDWTLTNFHTVTAAAANANPHLHLGCSVWGDKDPYADYDEVRVWSCALDAEQLNRSAALGPDTLPGMLIHRWSFNGDYADSVGGLTATAIGSATLSDGMVALRGGSKGTYSVDLGTNALNVGSDNVTIEIWARQCSVSSWARIFEYYTGTDKNNDIYMAWNTGSSCDTDKFEVKSGGSIKLEPVSKLQPYTLNTMFHISMVFTANSDGSTTVTCAKRDTSTGEVLTSYTGSISGWTLSDFHTAIAAYGTPHMYLGYSLYGDQEPNADYDEVRVWNYALSAAELNANALNGADELSSCMLAHRWSFNGDYTDWAGGLTATPTGSPEFGDGMIKLPGGTIGTANVDLGENALFVGSDNVTIEIWAQQHSAINFARLFEYYTGTGSSKNKNNDIYMSWNTSADNYNTDKVEVKTDGTVKLEALHQLQPYTAGEMYHISVVFAANSDGSTTVTYAKRDTTTGEVLTSYTASISDWTLTKFHTYAGSPHMYLGCSLWDENDPNADYNEVRVWRCALDASQLTASAKAGPDTLPDFDVISWTGAGATGDIEDPENWSSGSVPEDGSSVIIDTSNNVSFVASSAHRFAKVVFSGSGTNTLPSTVTSAMFEVPSGMTLVCSTVSNLVDRGLSGEGTFALDIGEGNTVTMTKSNTGFTGEFVVKSGTVKFGDAKSFGPLGRSAFIRVKNGATLDEAEVGEYVESEKSKVVLEEDATLSATTGLSDMKAGPITTLTLEGDATVDASNGNVSMSQHWNASPTHINLSSNTLTKVGTNVFYISQCVISGTGTIDVQGGTVRSVHCYYRDRQAQTTCSDGTIRIREGAIWNFPDYDNYQSAKTVGLTTKNLILDGSVTRGSTPYTLTVTGTITGNGTTPMLTMGDGAVFTPTGTGYLTISESLSGTMTIDASEVPMGKKVPLFKVGSSDILPSTDNIAFTTDSVKGLELIKTSDRLGYNLVRTGLIIKFR